ncbi:retrotransposon gag protein [Striga asiatica]|uniref:Retrotransposon gag protein n=1 Tax=Striga asiatica TaxID=4170 RepID=A0A5A7QFA0_STRAF|nr:retrotransposon gag protein [Striga asiatica]
MRSLYPPRPLVPPQAPMANPSSPSVEERLDKIFSFMTNQAAAHKHLETQVGQLATRFSTLEAEVEKGKLPSQPAQVKAITVLRSGREIDNNTKEDDKEKEAPVLHKSANPYKPRIPFPGRLREDKQEEQFRDLYNMLSKVNVNLPLLEVIRSMPAYVKFFKDLVTKKRRFGDGEKVVVHEASSAMQYDLPKKELDPGGFVIKIALGNGKEASGMLDLGAGINLMPFSIFQKLGLDRSTRFPKGVVEDVLVRVGQLIVPVDFVVLDVGDVQENGKDHTILLGRPFMATTNTLIDVKNGTLSMSVLGESVSISVHEAQLAPSFNYTEECAFYDDVCSTVEEMVMHDFEEQSMPDLKEEELSIVELFAIEQESQNPPNPELKELPNHLKYVFLDDQEKKPVIICAELTEEQEEELVEVLKRKQKAIGWSLADIKGISPATCMHRIVLEEGAKPFRDSQRRLNPNMSEVVKKEIIKLYTEGLIYPVADSEWVSPIHVVPKKGGITVIENDKKELFYCFLDGLSGYYQVAIAPEDQPKTTFTCPYGTFAFRRMPFGLCNAPGTFQRCMLSIFSDMLENCLELLLIGLCLLKSCVMRQIMQSGPFWVNELINYFV